MKQSEPASPCGRGHDQLPVFFLSVTLVAAIALDGMVVSWKLDDERRAEWTNRRDQCELQVLEGYASDLEAVFSKRAEWIGASVFPEEVTVEVNDPARGLVRLQASLDRSSDVFVHSLTQVVYLTDQIDAAVQEQSTSWSSDPVEVSAAQLKALNPSLPLSAKPAEFEMAVDGRLIVKAEAPDSALTGSEYDALRKAYEESNGWLSCGSFTFLSPIRIASPRQAVSERDSGGGVAPGLELRIMHPGKRGLQPTQTTSLGTMTELLTASAVASTDGEVYQLKISRLTIDKLGVKLYDRVSAVVAELVANSYDADATEVQVDLPLATLLSVQDPDLPDWTVSVIDNGHGLTPKEARDYYLRVGADRRKTGVGAFSRELRRPVMGRKGIGKLAPFGICKQIELISSGGKETADGYLTSHFKMDFDKITSEDSDVPVELEKGDLDGTYQPASGTKVVLTGFLPKRVPDGDVFMRQLERRFALAAPNFNVLVRDSRRPEEPNLPMQKFQIEVVESTRIDLSTRPVTFEDGTTRAVTGWVAMAKESYRNEEMAGVRIYARGKIVATTRDFEQRAGFTGEFATRSYMVCEVHANWLDDDDDEDLVRTDRQSILWESDKGAGLSLDPPMCFRWVGSMWVAWDDRSRAGVSSGRRIPVVHWVLGRAVVAAMVSWSRLMVARAWS